MNSSYFFITISFLLRIFPCYEIPLINLDLLNNGFKISLTDDPGIRKVFYVININDKCPGLMDLVLKSNDKLWSTTQTSVLLQNKDKLKISILINHNGEAYKSSQFLIVGENNNKATLYQVPNNRQSTKCRNEPRPNPDVCEPSQTIVRGLSKVCKNQLIFEENFANSDVDSEKWSFDIRNLLTGKPTEEFVVFDSNKENIFLRDGNLNIQPTVTQLSMRQVSIDFGSRCTPVSGIISECKLAPMSPHILAPPVNSSQIHTRNTFNFKYGRVEIKAKLPQGAWLLPHIMLQNLGPFERKQIRIAHARGNDQLQTTTAGDIGGRRLYGGWVIDGQTRTLNLKETYNSEHYGKKFHIYTVKWTKETLTMAVDGITYGEITENLNEFDDEFFLTLGVSTGGHLEFPDNLQNPAEKPWPNTSPRAIQNFWQSIKEGNIIWNGNETMLVDYVRVVKADCQKDARDTTQRFCRKRIKEWPAIAAVHSKPTISEPKLKLCVKGLTH